MMQLGWGIWAIGCWVGTNHLQRGVLQGHPHRPHLMTTSGLFNILTGFDKQISGQ